MLIGAHQSIEGGFEKALEKIQAIGGVCLQIFSASPRSWQTSPLTEKQVLTFRNHKTKSGIDPVYFHASYLVNLANTGYIGQKSQESLIVELNSAKKLGIKGSVVHLGSHKGVETKTSYSALIYNIQLILDKTADVLFIIENAGTHKIGHSLLEIGNIIRDVGDPRVRVCLDTCHLHASGHDLSTESNLDKFLLDFDKLVGLGTLELFHINDSKDEFGSWRDRHENIGEGKVGISVFKNILTHPSLNKLPFILETPGFDRKGPDKKNVEIAKRAIDL